MTLILLSVAAVRLSGPFCDRNTGMARAPMVAFLASLLAMSAAGCNYVPGRSDVSGCRASRLEGRRHADRAPVLFSGREGRGAPKPGEILVASSRHTGAQTETIPPILRADHHRSVPPAFRIAALFTGRACFPGLCAGDHAVAPGVVALPGAEEPAPPVTRSSGGNLPRVATRPAPPIRAARFVIPATPWSKGVRTATEFSHDRPSSLPFIGRLPDLRPLDLYRKFLRLAADRAKLVETASCRGAILLIIVCATGMAWGPLTQKSALFADAGRRP